MTRPSIPRSPLREARGPLLDPDVRVCIEEVEHMMQLLLDQQASRLNARLTKLQDWLSQVEMRISELEGKSPPKADDKYKLTKAQLIELAQELGYYDHPADTK